MKLHVQYMSFEGKTVNNILCMYHVSNDACNYTDSVRVSYDIPIPTDPSLNLSNLTSALDSLPGSEWKWFGGEMDVLVSMLDEIESQFHSDEERKTAVLRVCLADHPQPTWELVSNAVYRMGYHSVLERLQSLFPTGEHLSVPHISTYLYSCLPHSYIPRPFHPLPLFVSLALSFLRYYTIM